LRAVASFRSASREILVEGMRLGEERHTSGRARFAGAPAAAADQAQANEGRSESVTRGIAKSRHIPSPQHFGLSRTSRRTGRPGKLDVAQRGRGHATVGLRRIAPDAASG
jgi:hypothetical protein